MAASDPTFPYASNSAYSQYTTNGGISGPSASQSMSTQAYSSPLINFQRQALPNHHPQTVPPATTYVSAQNGLSTGVNGSVSYMSAQSSTRTGDAYASSSSQLAHPDYHDLANGPTGSTSGSNGIYQSSTQHASIRELSPSTQHDDAGHESATSSRESNGKRNTPNSRRKSNPAAKNFHHQNAVDTGDDSDGGGRNGSVNGKRQKLTRIHQACISCGMKKQKCTGGNPCDSCKTNGLDCAYKESKKR